jgi:hypothetical protein
LVSQQNYSLAFLDTQKELMLLLLALQSLKLAANSIKNIKDFSSFTETSIAVAVVDVVVVLT